MLDGSSVEIGPMDYGFDIDGILGFDLIREAKLVIDASRMSIFKATE